MNAMRSSGYFMLLVALGFVTGCSESADISTGRPSTEGSRFLLAKEPAGALGVREAVKQATDGREVVVVGRVGGEVNPWVDGIAAFTIVDISLTPCNERPGDSCPTPWDYCCDLDDLPTSSAAIKLVDERGKVVAESAQKMLALKELETVVVHGKAQRNAEGGLVVLADGLFVKPTKSAIK